MKLYVDDQRPCPDGFILARTIDEAKAYLSTGTVNEASLDHDMGACADCVATGAHVGDFLTPETSFMNACPHAPNGHDLALWMVKSGLVPTKVRVHSLNPVGRTRMRAVFAGSLSNAN